MGAYYAGLFRFALRYVPERETAEDLVHDVLFRIWEQRAGWEIHESLATYLYGAVRNRAIDYARHESVVRRWREHAVNRAAHSPEPGRHADRPDAALELSELDRAIAHAVGRLPERCRKGKLLDRIAKRVGWKKGEIRHRIFRHTYCAARFQTLDRGAPVSLYTVSREMGHGSEDMVRRMYAHLGAVRHRSEVVEFRVEQHYDRLGDQLVRLGFVINPVIKTGATPEGDTPDDRLTLDAEETWEEWARRDSNARPLAPEASALSN